MMSNEYFNKSEYTMPQLLGRHMPLEENAATALKLAHTMGCNAAQIFISSPRIWTPPNSPQRISELQSAVANSGLRQIIVHAAYLINLASAKDDTREKSRQLLKWTMETSAAIGVSDVVFHTGSHGGSGIEIGKERIIEGVSFALEHLSKPIRILFENDAGAGFGIGADFAAMKEMTDILSQRFPGRIGVCLDTAHLWGAGSDIGTAAAAKQTADFLDTMMGLERVFVLHFNDSRVPCGSHRDVHAKLGEGTIGLEGLRAFVQDSRLSKAVILLETPISQNNGANDWADETKRIAFARALAFTQDPISPEQT